MSPLTVVDAGRVLDLPRDADAWLDRLPGPLAIRARGRDATRTRLVSGMLHGNEPSGLRAIFHVLRLLRSGERFATDAIFFVGAVEAARLPPRHSHRMLPGRRDLNRCFRPPYRDAEGHVAEALLALAFVRARSAPLEAVVDLHNNSGHNPAYGVGVGLDAGRVGVTSLFAERYVASSLSLGSLVEAFPDSVASVTVECGRAGERRADETAIAGLSAFLRAEHLPRIEPASSGMQLLRDPVRVHVRSGLSLAFAERDAAPAVDVTMDVDADRHNFQRLAPGTRIGWVREGAPWPLVALDARGKDVSGQLFAMHDHALVTRRPLVPVMMTTNPSAAREDCLFYAVEDDGEIGAPRPPRTRCVRR